MICCYLLFNLTLFLSIDLTLFLSIDLTFMLQTEWPEGHKLAAAMNFRWPQMVRTPLKQIIPHGSNEGLSILADMLMWDPQKRPTCQQVHSHT